jgi:orotate phosphoribosyltransferase
MPKYSRHDSGVVDRCAGHPGLPVAPGVNEALRARQEYWAERDGSSEPFRLRQFLEPRPGERFCSSTTSMHRRPFTALKKLVENGE